ncbi:zinc-dependent alcohol dehydrogenase [Paenibacillus apiarius]|uniref:Zinc-binding alcohol dehydrogenase n=1 Tax=Paenibacillus apiarius TaxID=46240 RepID=A0ABT4E1I2_9BACL|nr:zinc-binding alcohol dehydrogenase [Paenibacillus apiarius]MCY9517740.1 zinc-binding alcohol dehydrogenase [Paenibacillus apiarius]MCY9523474.1 zinc-binding alcohol dehydrogenase [Paenibacillus apiarius]MCY9554971.1 zinc-binding alcohol dehydrogenase [Paenibacillus apiarius]MCY9561534.1 zinc-binding alcohol dehydrogenase [Paenibacillus apiarius]MCY9682208.1 zinc-binding alcohol dehydrogenase [Paenibacillus apiarius]
MISVVALDGQIKTVTLPEPNVKQNFVLVDTEYSAISPGTEMMMSEKQTDRPIPLGYSAAGIVREVGAGVTHVQAGQRVACYGAPFVRHAGLLAVPKHLLAPIPADVEMREAAFAGLGAIAIHALRQANLQFGEQAVVVGLGILGQLIGQIGNAASYHMLGYDLLPERCEVLRQCGIDDAHATLAAIEAAIQDATGGDGVDTVFLCTGRNAAGMIDQALTWVRDRGKVVIVGDLEMEFDRERMFSKEAQILISRAGGPGRYMREYEVDGIDYPKGYVRWTEGRNVGEYVRLLAGKRIQVAPLISAEMPVHEAAAAYERYKTSSRDTVGIVLSYPPSSSAAE